MKYTEKSKLREKLRPDEINEMKDLIEKHAGVLSDKTGITDLMMHAIKLTSNEILSLIP